MLACDAGDRATDPAQGPPLKLLSVSPAEGAGTECSVLDPACGVPTDTALRLELDRALLPSALARDVLRVYTGTPANRAPFAVPSYDLLSGVFSLEFTRALQPKALYQVELFDASVDGTGLRAFDTAPLDTRERPARWSFLTSAMPSGRSRAVLPTPTCDEVLQRLRPTCASGCCHGGPEPAMGLRLDDAEGLRTTAIARVAHQTDSGVALGATYRNPARFGVGMPIVDPGVVENSYLVYKVLIAPDNLASCEADCEEVAAFESASCRAWPEAERERMRDYFIQGAPMPLRHGAVGEGCEAAPERARLDCPTLHLLARWIDSGASCP